MALKPAVQGDVSSVSNMSNNHQIVRQTINNFINKCERINCKFWEESSRKKNRGCNCNLQLTLDMNMIVFPDKNPKICTKAAPILQEFSFR